MRLISLNREDAATEGNGVPSIRFADLLDDLVETTNNLQASPVNAQEASYTLLETDAGQIIRKTSDTANQIYTIPANTSVAFDAGTRIEVQNDGSVSLSIAITDDTLTFEADNTAGTRTIGPGGSGIFTKVDDTKWKARGEQMT